MNKSKCEAGVTSAHNFSSLLLKSELPTNISKASGLYEDTIEALKTKTYIIVCTKCGLRLENKS